LFASSQGAFLSCHAAWDKFGHETKTDRRAAGAGKKLTSVHLAMLLGETKE
jgi:hypothetical protein